MLARVQRLTREDYILRAGEGAAQSRSKLGAGMLVFVEVLLDRTTPGTCSSSSRPPCRCAPEIMECHMVAGGFDYLLKTHGRHECLPRVCGRRAVATAGVRETRTYAVMERGQAQHPLAACEGLPGQCGPGIIAPD